MRIGIDGTSLCLPNHCGIKNYSENLLLNLARLDTKNDYFIFVPRRYEKIKARNFTFLVFGNQTPFFKRQLSLNSLVKRLNLDVFHYLEPFGAITLNHPKIVTTVHDINLAVIYPTFKSFRYFFKRLYASLTRYFVVNKTREFIFVSETIYNEFLSHFKKEPWDVNENIIYEGVAKKFKPGSKKNSHASHILTMGDFSPRKNVETVLYAYNQLPIKVKSSYPLKIIASTKESAKNFEKMAKLFKIAKFVKIVINIPDTRLRELYQKALVFIYPSLYEGFGLPILEAMASGTVVITSEFGAMQEVAGEAAILVNPRDPNQITKSIIKITSQKAFGFRLKTLAAKRVTNFTWEKTAKKTLEVYQKV